MERAMRWTIACMACAQTLQARDEQDGRSVRCPCCGAALIVSRPAKRSLEDARAGETSSPLASTRKAFWRRHWIVASGGLALLVLLLTAAGATWANWLGLRGNPDRFGMMSQFPRIPLQMGMPPVSHEPPADEETLDLTSENSPMVAAAHPSAPSLPVAGLIAPCLALAGDATRGLLLAADPAGVLRWYDSATLELRGTCPLDQPAYQMVFDAASGMLYTASCPAKALRLSVLGEHEYALGQLRAYDLSGVLQGKPPPSFLPPTHAFPLRAHFRNLFLTADGTQLYYLAESLKDSHIGRLDTRLWTRDREMTLSVGATTSLVLSPTGSLHVLSGGLLLTIDPQTWECTSRLRVKPSVSSLVTGSRNRFYLMERKGGTIVHVVDLPTRKVLAHWSTNLVGRLTVRASPAGDRLYLASSAVLQGCIHEVDVSGDLTRPLFLRQARNTREHLIRGSLLGSPDGQFLVTGGGVVFRTSP
jgi:hypothetical protein